MKKHFKIFVIVVAFSLLISCSMPSSAYVGEEIDLYSVANNSLIWNNGKITGADFFYSPKIKVLEKDSYNRVMFAYPVKCGRIEYVSLIIMQTSNSESAWFYEDVNYICKETKVEVGGNGEYAVNFSKEEKEKLKEQNDWEKQLDFTKCVKVGISNEFKKHFSGDLTTIDEDLFAGKWCTIFMSSIDKFGRVLVGITDYEIYYVAILNFDYTYDRESGVIKVINFLNCQEEIKDLKKQNSWNIG